ncbi:hydrogenase formation protein HypD [bacterium]|nr:hydrogenase formation protein HypD [bacterium]
MKYIDEYRNLNSAGQIAESIAKITRKPHTIMEICGGQTHAIMKYGIEELLPTEITLLHGPGCPVCVTPAEVIDKAIEITTHYSTILCSFGDMIRVPGTENDLSSARADGGDVRVVYSPLDALKIARENPDKEVVFFAIGFETTAPVNAMSVVQAKDLGTSNFSLLVSQFLIPPAIESILGSGRSQVSGFLAPGHVCSVTGCVPYEVIARSHHVPIVVTGFEPVDILQGIYHCVKQLEEGRVEVENQYARSVRYSGNQPAQKLMAEVFQPAARKWRGIGEISLGSLTLREEYAAFNAEKRFGPVRYSETDSELCVAGQVLQGLLKPADCPAFGQQCTPDHPLGAPMVSSEGACAAYYKYQSNSRTSIHKAKS